MGLDLAFEALAVSLVGEKRGFVVIEAALMAAELLLNFGDVFRESGDLLCQRADPVIENLETDGVLNIGKH